MVVSDLWRCCIKAKVLQVKICDEHWTFWEYVTTFTYCFSFTQWRAMIHYLRYPNVDFNKMLEFLYQYDITKFPYWWNYVIYCHINHCTAQHLHYWCALMLKVLETKWNEVVSTCQATWLEDRAAQLASDGMVRCCDNASVLCYRVRLG